MYPTRQAKLLEAHLAAGTIATREVSEEMLRRYLGGSGLAARLRAVDRCRFAEGALY